MCLCCEMVMDTVHDIYDCTTRSHEQEQEQEQSESALAQLRLGTSDLAPRVDELSGIQHVGAVVALVSPRILQQEALLVSSCQGVLAY